MKIKGRFLAQDTLTGRYFGLPTGRSKKVRWVAITRFASLFYNLDGIQWAVEQHGIKIITTDKHP